MSGHHAPPPQKQAGRMSGNHALSTQQQGQQEDITSRSQTPAKALASPLREPQPGPGRCIDATSNTANDQPQHRPNNGNDDVDEGSKMHPPGAGQQHQQQQQQLQPATLAGSPHLPGGASQFPMQSGKRALHSSSSGPPPKKPTTQPDDVGGGHPVKRVGTDTLHPPHAKRRITGKTGPRSP